MLALLAERAVASSVCPSEVARRLAVGWRVVLPDVHTAAQALLRTGEVRLTQRGLSLDPGPITGPYRISRP